jgi:histidinol-phosphate/aromatic aminotransferase/cobyric acid decarboxylase-like protein
VNALAVAVVEPLLAVTDLVGWARAVAAIRTELVGALVAQGHDAVDTAANWILVRSGAPLRDQLAAHGVVVRDCTSFGLPDTFRVAVPRPTDVARVVAAFGAIAR